MPAGVNAGGQLNLLLFEVVAVTRDALTGVTLVSTVSIHPLVRVPANIQYTGTSRTVATQTIGGSQVNRAPRGFQQVNMVGNWGVESIGILPYIGTGEVRAERFYNEVVRMSEAVTREQVDDCVNILTGTPLIKALLAPYYAQPDTTSFAINFYDLWNQRKFQCIIRNYRDTRSFRNGGASGNIGYSMVVEEAGPIVLGSSATAALLILFDALTIWGDVNAVLESYTASAIVNSTLAIGAILTTQLERTKDAVVGQIESVTGLLGGAISSSNENLNAFLSDCRSLADTGKEIRAAAEGVRSPTTDAPQGGVNWGSPSPDLATWSSGPTTPSTTNARTTAPNADPDAFSTEFLTAFDESDVMDGLDDLIEAAEYQLVAGKLFGYSREEYHQLLSGSGTTAGQPRPAIRGSQPYVVTDLDTPESIELLFGVDFDEILAWNNMTPDEALVAGTRIEIPIRTAAAGTRRATDGLPVFGSQLGRAAWGADLRTDLLAIDGELVVIQGPDVLIQGANWLIEENQDSVLKFANALPEAGRATGLQQRIEDILLLDKRIVSVDDVQVTIDPVTGGVAIKTSTTAINGGIVQIGSR